MTDEPGLSIIFLEKITPEHFLIGNENQLDLIFIGGIVGNFIDTETLWELNIGRPIKNLAIDTKSIFFILFNRRKHSNRNQYLNLYLSIRQQTSQKKSCFVDQYQDWIWGQVREICEGFGFGCIL